MSEVEVVPLYTDIIPDQLERELFVEWVAVLVLRQFSLKEGTGDGFSRGASGETFIHSATLQDGTAVRVIEEIRTSSVTITSDGHLDEIRHHAREARALAGERNFGEPLWWRLPVESEPSPHYQITHGVHFMRILSEQKRLNVDCALADLAFFEVQEKVDSSQGPLLFAPPTSVTITFRTPGPGRGPLGHRLAEGSATTLRSFLAFATARPWGGISPVWAVQDEERDVVVEKLRQGPRQLAVDGVALWQYLQPLQVGDGEAFRRAQGAMFAYEESLGQASEFVATILLVSAIEALLVPNQPWQKERVSARFRDGALQACGEVAINEVLEHGNFVSAFRRPFSPRRFMDELYDLRSRPLHTGFVPQLPGAALGAEASNASMRVALISELARAAIKGFLNEPFSLLHGHPACDPATVARRAT